nr:helix-turn-helix transcriptional regulator [uncultured Agathobaculum sp.]
MSDLGNKEVFSQNLRRLMQRFGKDRNQVCEDLGIKYTTFNDWYNGNKYPRIDKIEMLANYFEVLKSDLVEKHSESQSEQLVNTQLHGILKWSKDKLARPEDTEVYHMHLAELLLRYKMLIERAVYTSLYTDEYLQSVEDFNATRSAPMSKQQLKEQYFRSELQRELDDLTGWINTFPSYLSKAGESSDSNK